MTSPPKAPSGAEREAFEAWHWDRYWACRIQDSEPMKKRVYERLGETYKDESTHRDWVTWQAALRSAHQGPQAEPRFFVDHGVLHDRKTGQHWHYRGYEHPNDAAANLLSDCEALNAMNACPGGVSESYLRRVYMDDREAVAAVVAQAEPVPVMFVQYDDFTALATQDKPHGMTLVNASPVRIHSDDVALCATPQAVGAQAAEQGEKK